MGDEKKFDWEMNALHDKNMQSTLMTQIVCEALRDLHDRVGVLEIDRGNGYVLNVVEVVDSIAKRVEALESKAHWHTMPFQNDDLRARVEQFVMFILHQPSDYYWPAKTLVTKLHELELIEKKILGPARPLTDLEERVAQFVEYMRKEQQGNKFAMDKLRELGLAKEK